MQSEVKVFERENGKIQRVHVVRWDEWEKLEFLPLQQNTLKEQIRALGCFRDIYVNYIVPVFPWIIPQIVMYSLPDDVSVETIDSKKYGKVTDRSIAASIMLQKGVKIKNGKPVFADNEVEKLWRSLEIRDCIHIISGKLPHTQVIHVSKNAGYLSENVKCAQMKVNANFFIMDPFDCATIYDQIGSVLGLCVKNGKVLNPPMYNREALLVKMNGEVLISQIDIRELSVEIDGVTYKHGENATIYTRPERGKTPLRGGTNLVIVGSRVVAVKEGGSVEIPTSGFVLHLPKKPALNGKVTRCGGQTIPCVEVGEGEDDYGIQPGAEVIYHGLEDIRFGIQVGNSIVRDGIRTKDFISRFYNIKSIGTVAFPPSLYPLDYEKARAARIALGTDRDGKPVLFWAEGAGKFGIHAENDSTGASLSEMADIAIELDLIDAVNLDGGGSAQILLNNERSLMISDRKKEDNTEAERLVPIGLLVR